MASWHLIADKLKEFQDIKDDEYDPPTERSLHAATKLVQWFRAGAPWRSPPDNVVPDGDGGVVLEWRALAGSVVNVHVWCGGEAEEVRFVEGRVVERRNIHV